MAVVILSVHGDTARRCISLHIAGWQEFFASFTSRGLA
jgi:hypothetical protein